MALEELIGVISKCDRFVVYDGETGLHTDLLEGAHSEYALYKMQLRTLMKRDVLEIRKGGSLDAGADLVIHVGGQKKEG